MPQVPRKKLLGALCLATLCTILVAGLWPFNFFPRNRVWWLPGGEGLRFGHYGSIRSTGSFPPGNVTGNAPCALEIWIQPDFLEIYNTILSFYTPDRLASFSLQQSTSDLLFQVQTRDANGKLVESHVLIEDILNAGGISHVVISSDGNSTNIYVDAVRAPNNSGFVVSRRNFNGMLVVGDSPVTTDSWRGNMYALALYDRELLPAEVQEHFADWKKNGRPVLSAKDNAAAIYRFSQKSGNLISDETQSAPDLVIPSYYAIAQKPFLEVPWSEFKSDPKYFRKALVNVVGFIPLGLVFYAYFSSIGQWTKSSWITVLLGFAVSLTIEILQAFIPFRESGTTDILTNTMGTVLGVLAYRGRVQTLFASVFRLNP